MFDENQPIRSLLQTPVHVVNVGLEGFALDLEQCGTPVMHVDWSPPARGDAQIADLLSKLGG